MAKAQINPKVLKWARERAGLTRADLGNGIGLKRIVPSGDVIATWESGQSQPTFDQAQKCADKLHIPFGYLFLSEPPEDEKLPIPDLRTLGGRDPEPLSLNFRDLLQDVLYKQDWFREYRQNQGWEPLPFLGQFSPDGVDELAVARHIRNTLKLDTLKLPHDPAGRTRELFRQCEEKGISVIRTNYIGNKSRTHKIPLSEFRGMALHDPLVPFIVINSQDALSAQIFTLAHELAHLWLGESGISHLNLKDTDHHFFDGPNIERICNAIAAETLVPRNQFIKKWDQSRTLAENCESLFKQFHVSRVVIARRALELNQVNKKIYQRFYRQQEEGWQATKAKEKERQEKSTGGPKIYATKPFQNGRKFYEAVVCSARSGELLYREASGLLHMSPTTIKKAYRKL